MTKPTCERFVISHALFALALACCLAPRTARAQAAAKPARPNIVLILADDLGYSDLGCYGSEIKTPHLDALAVGGLRFTQFYNSGRCCPTRASLMTGLYPHQAGVGRMTNDANLPGYRGRLTNNAVTIAEVLRAAGYRTAMTGKWHLSNTAERPDQLKHLNNQSILDTFSDLKTYPVGRGFEEHYGVIWGVVNYFDPFSLVHNADAVREVPRGYYITDAINDHAVEYIASYGKGVEPFFLYVADVAPHWPLHALEEDVRKYEDVYKAGWDMIRNARHARMKDCGALPPGADNLGPRNEPDQSWEANSTRAWDARAMAVHAAMVDRLDQGVGRIVNKLRETKQLDNTLILFLSDNGASPEVMTGAGFDRPSETRDGRKIHYLADKSRLPGPEDTYGAIGPFWATVANQPLRLWKGEMYEGGICTPMIAHWPAGLRAKPGAVTHDVGHVVDVMATCVELAGAAYPKEFNGHPITPLAGRSLAAALRGEKLPERDTLSWEHMGARAIRQGDWKLVARRTGPWSLYNLSKDRPEQHDLAADQPQRAAAMAAEWEAWAKATAVLPAPPGGRWSGKSAGAGPGE